MRLRAVPSGTDPESATRFLSAAAARLGLSHARPLDWSLESVSSPAIF